MPNSFLRLATIPSTVVEGKIIPLDLDGPQHNVPKKELDSRVLAERVWNLPAKNLLVHVENFPRTILIRMSFHGVNDANGEVPSSTCNFALPRLMCNGLGNAKRAHETFAINLGDEPSSPKVNEATTIC